MCSELTREPFELLGSAASIRQSASNGRCSGPFENVQLAAAKLESGETFEGGDADRNEEIRYAG